MIHFYFIFFYSKSIPWERSTELFKYSVRKCFCSSANMLYFLFSCITLALTSKILDLELFGMCQREFSFFFSLILRTIAHRCESSRIISVGNSHRFILLYISHRLDKMKLDFAWTCNVNTKLSRTYEAFADFITKWNFPVNLIHMTRCVRGGFFCVYVRLFIVVNQWIHNNCTMNKYINKQYIWRNRADFLSQPVNSILSAEA